MLSRHKARRAKRTVIGVATAMCIVLGGTAYRIADTAVSDWLGTSAYESGNYVDAARYFSRNLVLNVTEPWLAPFDRGTARFALREWAAAESDYRSALPLAPEKHRCRVALNLAWTLEARGDDLRRANLAAEALDTWQQARDILRNYQCPDEHAAEQQQLKPKLEQSEDSKADKDEQEGKPEQPEPDQGQQEKQQQEGQPQEPKGTQKAQQQQTEQRLDKKTKALEGQSSTPGMADKPEEASGQEKQQELQERQEAAAAKARQEEEQKPTGQDKDNPGGKREEPDRPNW